MRALVAAALAATAAGCLPDFGKPMDAGTERAPMPDASVSVNDGGTDPVAIDGPKMDVSVSTCDPVTQIVNFISLSSSYSPEEVVVPSSNPCIRICIHNLGGEAFHQNTSDERLFPDFVTRTGEEHCETFFRTIGPGIYGITCTNHSGMTARIVVSP